MGVRGGGLYFVLLGKGFFILCFAGWGWGGGTLLFCVMLDTELVGKISNDEDAIYHKQIENLV